MKYYTNERNIKAWFHEALVMTRFGMKGYAVDRAPLAVSSDIEGIGTFKETKDFGVFKDGLHQIVHVKSWQFLDHIPYKEDPIEFIRQSDFSSYDLSNQKQCTFNGDRWVPIDLTFNQKFCPDEITDFDDKYMHDWYSNRIFAVADSEAAVVLIFNGQDVYKYPERKWCTAHTQEMWNFLPIDEVREVWRFDDTDHIRTEPWKHSPLTIY